METLEKTFRHQGAHLPREPPLRSDSCSFPGLPLRTGGGVGGGLCQALRLSSGAAPSSWNPGQPAYLWNPSGLHVLHIVVLDLAEEPDPFLRPLDCGRERAGVEGQRRRLSLPQGPWTSHLRGSQLGPCSGCGGGRQVWSRAGMRPPRQSLRLESKPTPPWQPSDGCAPRGSVASGRAGQSGVGLAYH